MFRILVSEVGVVFHSAATIRFDEKMTEVGEIYSDESLNPGQLLLSTFSKNFFVSESYLQEH